MPTDTRHRLKTVVFLVLNLAATQIPSLDVRLAVIVVACGVLWVPDGRPRQKLSWVDYLAIGAIAVAAVLAVVSRFVELPPEVERPLAWAMGGVLVVVMLAMARGFVQLIMVTASGFREIRTMGRQIQAEHPEMAGHITSPAPTGPRMRLARWLLWGTPPWRRR